MALPDAEATETRDYGAAMQSQRLLTLRGARIELNRRDAIGEIEQRWKFSSHVLGTMLAGGYSRGSLSRYADLPAFNSPQSPGNLSLMPAGIDVLTRVTKARAMDYMLVLIDPALVADVTGGRTLTIIPNHDLVSPTLSAMLARLSQELSQPSPVQRLFADAAILVMVSEMLRCSSNLRIMPPSAPARGGLAPHQLRRVTDYIADNLADELTLAELSGLAGLSAHHFCRAFKQSTGTPPHRWQMQLRVARAQELMRATALSLAQIAAACGFSDQSHFTTVFRKSAGATPSVWRRQQRD